LNAFSRRVIFVLAKSADYPTFVPVLKHEGNGIVPFFFLPMDQTALIINLQERAAALIGAEKDLFVVEVRIKPTNNVKVYIDGDQGVSVDKLVSYNRKLYRQLEEEGIFPNGDFSLELSSPGLDEPLRLHRQYVKNIGRPVEVVLIDGSKKEGVLQAVDQTKIELIETKGKGKKMETHTHVIAFSEIKATKIQIKF
jgi:ribosome maturation factor RimP